MRAAVISAVSPSGSAVFGSAPAASSRSIIVALPVMEAAMIGVTPYRFAAFTSAFAARSSSTAAASSRSTASSSAVLLSEPAALTSTRACSSWRIAA